MNGIQEHQRRETFKRWWNYRGLWRESLDERPSAASVYRWLLISCICLFVLLVYVISYYHEYVNGIRQSDLTFTFPSIEEWLPTTLTFMILLIVYGILWHWGKIKNNRHIISVLMYLMLFLIGALVALNVGSFYRVLDLRELDRFIYEAYGLKNLFAYLMMSTLLLSPILLAWIQGWRQAFIFSMIFLFPLFFIMALGMGTAIG